MHTGGESAVRSRPDDFPQLGLALLQLPSEINRRLMEERLDNGDFPPEPVAQGVLEAKREIHAAANVNVHQFPALDSAEVMCRVPISRLCSIRLAIGERTARPSSSMLALGRDCSHRVLQKVT